MGETATATHYLSHNPLASLSQSFWGSKENRKRDFTFLWLLRFVGSSSFFPGAIALASANALSWRQPELVAMPRARER